MAKNISYGIIATMLIAFGAGVGVCQALAGGMGKYAEKLKGMETPLNESQFYAFDLVCFLSMIDYVFLNIK